MEYAGVIAELSALEFFSASFSPHHDPLQKFREALALLDLDIPARKVIVVAGTNGKGSVCATLEALLLSTGQTVGLFTSPHLIDPTERIRLQGLDLTKDEFTNAFEAVKSETNELGLNYFEVLTLMAVWTFASGITRAPCDWMILEVGLGGLWDPTNAIPHHFSVITALGIDHEKWLGSTLPEIAKNKFGIASLNGQVVHARFPEETIPVMNQVRQLTQSTWSESCDFELTVKQTESGPLFYLRTQWGEARVQLPGERGAENSALALSVFQKLGFDPSLHLQALNHVRWPGRMEKLHPEAGQNLVCPIYFSGDHNGAGVRSLIALLRHYPRETLKLVVGVAQDKNLDEILGPLFALPSTEIHLTETPYKTRRVGEYGHWGDKAASLSVDPLEALTKALRNAKAEDMVLVTGSLYLVGHLKKQVKAVRF